MAFKGIISSGSPVEASFSSDLDNSGMASLLIGLTAFSGKADADGAVVAIGGNRTVHLTAGTPGLLRIFVDVAEDDDTGLLEVKVNGAPVDREGVSGDTTWTYSVQ